MAGEIRAKMEQLRAARQRMNDEIAKEIDAVIGEVQSAHSDGLDALKLPRAEIDATRQEIAEIRAEFAPKSNGGPAGPLPGSEPASQQPSANSAQQGSQQPAEPAASWQGNKT